MNRKFNSQLNNLGTFFKDLKEDVILLDDGKDTSYHRELLRVCTINSLYKLENLLRHDNLLHRSSHRVWNLIPLLGNMAGVVVLDFMKNCRKKSS